MHRGDPAPYKVVRCRHFDRRGKIISSYCPDGGFCRFLHPHDKGWPGLDPKPSYRSEGLNHFISPSSSRKRSRSPFGPSKRSISPDPRYKRECRSVSPARNTHKSYSGNRYSHSPKFSSYRESPPPFRRQYSPIRPSYRDDPRPVRGLIISEPNNISIISPRSSRPRLSIDTNHTSSSPELRTPSDYQDASTKSPLNRRQRIRVPSKGNSKPVKDVDGVFLLNEESQLTDKSRPIHPSARDPYGLFQRPRVARRDHVDPSPPENTLANHNPSQSVSEYNETSVSPKESLASDRASNTIALINKLTKAHLRLLDNRKAYEDESLKLQAFESLATKFDIPITKATSPLLATPVPGFGPFGSAFTTSVSQQAAFHSSKVQTSKVTPTGTRKPSHGESTSLPPIQNIRKERLDKRLQWDDTFARPTSPMSQADDIEMFTSIRGHHNFTSYEANEDAGQKIAQHALLETLNGIRERQKKIGKRVHNDFEEMASVLEMIWTGTLDMKNVSETGHLAGMDKSRSIADSDDRTATSGGGRQSYGPEKPSRSALFATSEMSRKTGAALPTAVDPGGKVVKKLRRVSFDDEIGMNRQERNVLRCLEESITGMERKFVQLGVLEKENVKMKAELQTQKESIEKMKKQLEEQGQTIAQLVAHSHPDTPKAELQEGL